MLLGANNQQWGAVMQSDVKQSYFYNPIIYYFPITAICQLLNFFKLKDIMTCFFFFYLKKYLKLLL